jgi:hypothetical protein
MTERTTPCRVRATSDRVYTTALRGIAALVVLTIFVGLAYPVAIDKVDGGALLLSAGVILGYIRNAVWSRR